MRRNTRVNEVGMSRKTRLKQQGEPAVRSVKAAQHKSTSYKPLPILITVTLVISAVVLHQVWYQPENNSSCSLNYTTSNVNRIVHPPSLSYRTIAESRTPVILTHTIIDKWLARKIFTTKFFAEKLHHVLVYHQEKQRHFITFHDNKPLEPLVLNEAWNDYNIKINITIPKLLGWDNTELSHTKGPWNYFSQDIQQLRKVFPDVLRYVQPIDELILSEDNVQVNLWIGRAGIITHTHYDATYNFFVQLQGRKRFTLFPPNQTMYLYPCLHPHYGHGQLNILDVNIEEYPLFKNSQAFIAEVGPGDMLVVPPYWFHHVETLEESVSINIWSDAPEYALMNEIYGQPIPFEEEWMWSDLVIATKIYSEIILTDLGINDIVHFIHNLVTQRYMPLVKRGNLAFNYSHYQQLDHLFKVTDWGHKKQTYQDNLLQGSNNIISLFRQIPSMSVIKICVGNYIEHLIHRVVGLDYVCPFLSVFAEISLGEF